MTNLMFKTLTLILFLLVGFLVILYLLTNVILNRPTATPLKTFDFSREKNLYFSYGSNMSYKYLRNIRRVEALSVSKATLPRFELHFNLPGVGFLEPAFANIQPNESSHVEGVLYELTESGFRKIIDSEPENYEKLKVNVLLPNGEVKNAHTLISKLTVENKTPSKRYLSLLVTGCTENRLSPSYIESIKANETTYYPILSEVFGSFVYFTVLKNALLSGELK